ncbi:hypothetical protein ACFLTX_02950 [Chloroflexota bacterium]
MPISLGKVINRKNKISWKVISSVLGSSWFEILYDVLKLGNKLISGLSSEGMYEVLEYEATLELHDSEGRRASFKKRKKIRYLQNNIIAYPDYAWGDGKILLDFKCSPGIPVDRYRSGFKTFILLSLREVKNKGDTDEFNIQWKIKDGFLVPECFWDTDITNRTRSIQINLIFPKSRRPKKVSLMESNTGKTKTLPTNAKQQLPDGRWIVTWEKKSPRLYEHYLLKWSW